MFDLAESIALSLCVAFASRNGRYLYIYATKENLSSFCFTINFLRKFNGIFFHSRKLRGSLLHKKVTKFLFKHDSLT